MGYLNNQTGYRAGMLETRSVVKKENYVVLEPDGLVKNSVPGYDKCDVTIMGSPAMGASFADYLVTVREGGGNRGLGAAGIEVFLYVLEGEVQVKNDDVQGTLSKGGYIYSPEGNLLTFFNHQSDSAKLFIYKRRYEALDDLKAHTVIGNERDLEWIPYEGMENCMIKDFLPSAKNLGFDMNMHILKFLPGASHGYIETHIQEHGMYALTGAGMYRLDNDWVPVKAGDYVFMDAYCPQACYAVGKDEAFSYIYSKDCNRDVRL